ncbi:MAG: hypothetical protein Q4C71_03330 [Microbacteriaceae bacterium]|nr:hypothetical protein [Microbacteriaceae bacterium]
MAQQGVSNARHEQLAQAGRFLPKIKKTLILAKNAFTATHRQNIGISDSLSKVTKQKTPKQVRRPINERHTSEKQLKATS